MLRRLPLLLLVAFASLPLPACGGGGSGGIPFLDDPPPPAGEMSEEERSFAMQVLALVNEERTERQIAPVTWDEACSRAAYGHAVDMDVRNYFDHYDPQGRGPGDRLRAQGVSFSIAAENIARGQGGPESVMAAWMSSTGHRNNILNPAFERLGVGVHIALDGPWWVQNFVD